jgi:hypothetical protein
MFEYRFTPPALAAAAGLAPDPHPGNGTSESPEAGGGSPRTVTLYPSRLTPSQRAAIPAHWGAHWVDAARDAGIEVGLWWTRVLQGPYLPPLVHGEPSVTQFLEAHGWALRTLPQRPPARQAGG